MRWRLGLLALLLAAPASAQDRTPPPPWTQDAGRSGRSAPDAAPQAPAQGAAEPLLLRLAISPQGPVWVGQRIEVTLTAMTPARFAAALAWPDIVATRGRIVVLPEASTIPGTERVGGRSYAALQHSYSVFAAEAGPLVIAPVAMAAQVAGPDGRPIEAHASTPETRLTARLPPGVTDVARLVVSPTFRMTAAVEGNALALHVGEALVRTLCMEADDTSSMLLPPAAWGQPEGVRVYPDPPVLQDRSARGVFHALRSERVAFVPQRPGRVELPGFAVSWFDPRSGRMQQVAVDPLRLDVRPAAASGATASAHTLRVPWLLAVSVAGVAALGGAILWRRRRQPAPIRALAAACRAGDGTAALRALYRWADATLPPGGERTIAALARLAAVPELATEAARLDAQGGWDGRALVAAARRTEGALRHPPRAAQGALPPLNPTDRPRQAPRLAQPRWMR